MTSRLTAIGKGSERPGVEVWVSAISLGCTQALGVVNTIPGDNTSGQVDGDFILRYPLDLVNPNLHLAPSAYAGVGGLFSESGGFGRFVTATAKFESSRKDNRVLGDFGGGLEYRFTPHIGIFSEVGYNVVDGPRNNFMQVNFGAKFAF